ncbi:MAG: NADH-quinone oxidoreductase subunit L [Candidatus Omnitrophica bacterium]|nr:NADH-quinone oxidoreductase subunit L [Candidatus Omnitrophota bacterium]
MALKFLWVIQLAPLAAFLGIQLLPAKLKKIAPGVAVPAALMAATAASWLFWSQIQTGGRDLPGEFSTPWLVWPGRALEVGFLMDRLNLLMIWLVTVISFFVQLFSVYYMDEDPSRARYFGFLSFFAFSMTGLVLSNNLLQTFIFWELVGLTSYLLIGFWIEKPSAATAARKAFVINRLGDLGFYLGVILLFLLFGTLNFRHLTTESLAQALPPRTLTMLGLLVFTGVMGKSAQFPFHNWLPDAMEGPTPVSALIHSATMVAAGVFLLARAFGLFGASAFTLSVILTVGFLTAFVGAALATIQFDIKKILAYSTISQLGLMVMAIGAGSSLAGMFHLSTHAFFKSLLFLTAGVFIHRTHTNDIDAIAEKGGRRDVLAVAMLVTGLASLCGLPPFAGFFSKDMVLETLKERSFLFYSGALFVSFLTVYYSCRLLFVVLFSEAGHPRPTTHDSRLLNFSRAVPLVSLGAISVVMGLLGSPLNAGLLEWLGGPAEVHFNASLFLVTLGLLAGGGGLAYFRFRNPAGALQAEKEGQGLLLTALRRKFFVDEAYDFLVKKVALAAGALFDAFDRKVINGWMVNGTSYNILKFGRLASKLQSGLLQDYLSLAFLAGIVIVFFVVL